MRDEISRKKTNTSAKFTLLSIKNGDSNQANQNSVTDKHEKHPSKYVWLA